MARAAFRRGRRHRASMPTPTASTLPAAIRRCPAAGRPRGADRGLSTATPHVLHQASAPV